MSHYHGCEMEGPTIRSIMMNGPKVFAEIATFLKAVFGTYPSRVSTDDESEEVCSSYGDLYLLLDSSFLSTISRSKNLLLVKYVS